MRLDRIPKHLIILGAGYIGCEYAQIYRRLGSEVTLVDRNTRFLPKEDADIGQGLLELFKDEGIRVLLGAKVQSVSGRSSQGVSIKIQSEQMDFSIDGTDLLVALGREPNTEELDLSNAGVDLDQRGHQD